jgi:hypothetical protein
MAIPKSFTAGESIEWRLRLELYSVSAAWEVVYHLRGSTEEATLEIAAIADGDSHLVNLKSIETIDYQPGMYWWQCFAKKDDDVKLVASGECEIKPNLTTLAHYDGRSHVKKVLDALENTLLGKAGRDQLSYSIAGRSLSRMNPSELLEWRDKYKAEYAMLQRKAGQFEDQTIRVRFTS